jgi:succinoglycan biosynthesis protein ExoM
LDSIVAQQMPNGTSLEIIVVDNDDAGTAGELVRKAAMATSIPIRYEIEPIQNIALARNRTIAMAQGEWLAFIDDDETAEPGWLSTLLAASTRYNADIVSGLIMPVYDPSVPDWIKKSGIIGKPRPPSGTALDTDKLSTGNALVRAELLLGLERHFDASYGLTGGSDTELFERLLAAGARAVSCPEAVVWHEIPQSRTTLRYLVKKAVRHGETSVRIKYAEKGPAAVIAGFAESIIKLSVFVSIAAVRIPLGRAGFMLPIYKALSHWGKLRAFCGVEPVRTYAQ